MNKKIKVLLYGANLWYLGEGMLGPFLAVFAQRIGGSVLDISWAWAIYLIVQGVLSVFAGKYSDGSKISKEKMMTAGYALNAIFTFGYLFVSSPVQLFFIQAGLGVAAAISTPTWNALYAKHEDRKHDGYIWGIACGEFEIVTGIAIIIGGLIVNYYSFVALFVIMGIIQVIATIYQAKIIEK